jgi:phosphoglycerate dehydrogenase-like enzyme
MEIVTANRSPVEGDGGIVDRYVPLDDLGALYDRADFLVCALPLTEDTRSLVDAAAFARMRPTAFVINVGRGPVIDEAALYHALRERRIAGACIDTWYVYPRADDPNPQPSRLPFRELDNVTMTPHMSGWTFGTRRRRQRAMALNLDRLAAGEPLLNVVRPARG